MSYTRLRSVLLTLHLLQYQHGNRNRIISQLVSNFIAVVIAGAIQSWCRNRRIVACYELLPHLYWYYMHSLLKLTTRLAFDKLNKGVQKIGQSYPSLKKNRSQVDIVFSPHRLVCKNSKECPELEKTQPGFDLLLVK